MMGVRKKAAKGERLFIASMNNIGDVLFTTPALSALRSGYPDSYICVMVGERAKDVLLANPNVNNLYVRPKTIRERLSLLLRLRREKFTISVCFASASVELAAWGFLLGCHKRYGFHRLESRFFSLTQCCTTFISTGLKTTLLSLAKQAE